MSVYDALATGRPHRSQVMEATVSTAQPAPESFSDPLFVVPDWNQEIFWRITDWPLIHGAALPQPGAQCAVLVSDDRTMRVVWWDGQYTVPGVDPTINNQRSARAYFTGSLSVPISWTKVPVNNLSWNDSTDGMDIATNHRFNVTIAGDYLVTGNLFTQSVSAGFLVGIGRNGSGPVANSGAPAVASNLNIPNVTDVVRCAAGDYLELWALSSTTAALNAGASPENYLTVARLI